MRVCDEFDIEGEATYTERIVSYVEPTLGEGFVNYGKARVEFDPKLASAKVTKDIHALELNTDGSLKRGVDVYLTDIDVKEPKSSFTFDIVV